MVLPDQIEVTPLGADEQRVSCGGLSWTVRATDVPGEYEVTDSFGGQYTLQSSSMVEAVGELLRMVWEEGTKPVAER